MRKTDYGCALDRCLLKGRIHTYHNLRKYLYKYIIIYLITYIRIYRYRETRKYLNNLYLPVGTFCMIITVTSLKGGSGKTTVTQNLAVAFAHAGYKVAIADVDQNQNSLLWSSLRPDHLPNVFVSGYPVGKGLMKNAQELNEQYDIILIDGTPTLDSVTSTILQLANLVLIPIISSGFYDVMTAETFIERLSEIQDVRGTKIPAFFVLNQYDKRSKLSHSDTIKALTSFGVEALKSPLRDLQAFKSHAPARGLGVLEYSDRRAKEDIIALSSEIIDLFDTL